MAKELQYKKSDPRGNLLSFLILLFIVLYSLFKYWILNLFSWLIYKILSISGFSRNILIDFIKHYYEIQVWEDYKTGAILYFLIYFLLHIFFIYFLFRDTPKLRIGLIIGLVVVVGSMALALTIGWYYKFKTVYFISWNLFHDMFVFPFLLFAIEGGKIIWTDVKKGWINPVNDK